MNYKKSQIFQMLFILMTIFVVGVTLLAGKYILTEVNTGLEDSGLHTNESRTSMTQWMSIFYTFDYMMVFIFVGLTFGLLVSSYFIPSHPGFLVINIIGLFIMVFFAIILSNMYAEMIDPGNDAFYSVVSDGSFTKLTFIMQYMPWLACIIVFFSTIAMYAKAQGGGPL